MKKVILILVLLILATGTGFYFGWVNVEPETFSLAHSTLTGTLDYPLESGNIHWLWQKLVPKSFHLYTFKKEPYSMEIEFLFPLPGSEELKEYGNFAIGGTVVVQYRVDYDTANVLLEYGIIEDFEIFFSKGFRSRAEESLTQYVLDRLSNYSLMTESFDYAAIGELKKQMESSAADYAEEYKLSEVKTQIAFSVIPQIETYQKALSRYFEYMENISRMKTEDIKLESKHRLMREEDDVEIERLRKYGELIDQYPGLLKYFYIEKFSEQTRVLVLPESESTGFPKMLEQDETGRQKELLQPEPEQKAETLPPAAEEEKPLPEGEIRQEELVEGGDSDRWYNRLKFWELIKK